MRAGVTSRRKDSFCHEDLANTTGLLDHGIVGVVEDTLCGKFDFF